MVPRLRASAVCTHNGRLLCVRLRDPVSRVVRLFVPGGAIEPDETPRRAAERETLEETGYAIVAEAEGAQIVSYPFRFGGADYAVTTHFFRGSLRDPRRVPRAVHDASFHEGVHWLPLADVARELGFHREILHAVTALARR